MHMNCLMYVGAQVATLMSPEYKQPVAQANSTEEVESSSDEETGEGKRPKRKKRKRPQTIKEIR